MFNLFKKIINKNKFLSLFISALISFFGIFILSPIGSVIEDGLFIFLGLILGIPYFLVFCNLEENHIEENHIEVEVKSTKKNKIKVIEL